MQYQYYETQQSTHANCYTILALLLRLNKHSTVHTCTQKVYHTNWLTHGSATPQVRQVFTRRKSVEHFFTLDYKLNGSEFTQHCNTTTHLNHETTCCHSATLKIFVIAINVLHN